MEKGHVDNSVLQKPQGPEHEHRQKQAYLETSRLESSTDLAESLKKPERTCLSDCCAVNTEGAIIRL